MLTPPHSIRSKLGSDRRGAAGLDYALLAALMGAVIAYSGWPLAAREGRMFADLGATLDGAEQPHPAHTWRAEVSRYDPSLVGAAACGGLAIGVSSPRGVW